MFDFTQAALAVERERDWLSPLRAQGKSVWQHYSLPTRKTENWKYTNLSFLQKQNYFARQISDAPLDPSLSALYQIPEFEVHRLVFVNGRYAEGLSSLSEDSALELSRFEDADDLQRKIIAGKLNTNIELKEFGFSALNTSQLSDGVFLRVKRNRKVDKPIQVVWLTTSESDNANVNSRLLMVLESGAEASLLEHYVSSSESHNVFTNAVTELFLGANAKLTHYRLHKEQESAVHIGAVFATLESAAHLNSFYLAFGSRLKRLDVHVEYEGEGAESHINGVYLPKNKQHVDIHSCIEHKVPHCRSNEVFRGIVADEARAVFNGRIHIHKDAQKTEAYLSNKNLLTSNKAEVDTKPELEIYADDVRCAHGATVAQLDPMSLHYLRTRGVSENEALVMLSFGFINELIAELKHEAISHYLRPAIAQLFSRDPALVRHLL